MTREKALEIVRKMEIRPIPENADLIMALHTLIPELRESEDERIRKDLIGGLMWQRDNLKSEGPRDNNLILPGFCFTVGELLAYLEKQKEQKPTPDWMPKFLDELRSKKNYFDWDEHRDIEGHILAIIDWIAPDYIKRKEEQKPETF